MPQLIVFAGCNGAGKSTFASSFLAENLISFDYDKLFLKNYAKLADSELRYEIADKETEEMFLAAIETAITNNADFCYETNFDNNPIYWPEYFKNKGYKIRIIFFCLKDLAQATERVSTRVVHGGHDVTKDVIRAKWKAGYENIDSNFSLFDSIFIVENARNRALYKNLVEIDENIATLYVPNLPSYFENRLPKLLDYINKMKTS